MLLWAGDQAIPSAVSAEVEGDEALPNDAGLAVFAEETRVFALRTPRGGDGGLGAANELRK